MSQPDFNDFIQWLNADTSLSFTVWYNLGDVTEQDIADDLTTQEQELEATFEEPAKKPIVFVERDSLCSAHYSKLSQEYTVIVVKDVSRIRFAV